MSPEHQSSPKSPEQEYRDQLTSEIVESATGSVGIYTSLTLESGKRGAVMAAVSERNPEAHSGQNLNAGSGWGNWGERALTDNPDFLQPLTRTDGEELRIAERENGDVEFMYSFSSSWYKDDFGRPGNALNVGFQLPKEQAETLERAIQADPSYINEVIKAQVLSVGFDKQTWDTKVGPRFSPYEQKPERERILRVSRPNQESVSLEYGENKSIRPEAEELLAEPTPKELRDFQETAASNLAYAKELTADHVSELKADGKTPKEIIDTLQSGLNFLHDKTDDPYFVAYTEAIEQIQHDNEIKKAQDDVSRIFEQPIEQRPDSSHSEQWQYGYTAVAEALKNTQATASTAGEAIGVLEEEMSTLSTGEWDEGARKAYRDKIDELIRLTKK